MTGLNHTVPFLRLRSVSAENLVHVSQLGNIFLCWPGALILINETQAQGLLSPCAGSQTLSQFGLEHFAVVVLR